MTGAYRLRQGFQALFAFARPLDLDLAASFLSPALLRLFQSMNRGEQLHSLKVLADVLAQGETPPELAVAALLHDVGKSRYPLAVWQKTLAVLVSAVWSGLYRRWSQGDAANLLQRPFVVYECHPSWGAEMLRQAGASEMVCWLVEHHADLVRDSGGQPRALLLERLQQADDAN
jgi:hypothetical protein